MRIVLLLGCSALVACTTSPVSRADAEPATSVVYTRISKAANPTSASLTVRRDSGLMAVACAHAVRLDGKLIATLGTSEQVVVYPAAGEHVLEVSTTGLWCGANQQAGIPIQLAAGRAHTYRTGMSGFFNLLIQATPEDSPLGAAEATTSLPAPAPQRANVAKAPLPVPSGQSARDVERMHESRSCAASPRAEMIAKGPGSETYRVPCDNGETFIVRCEFGNCRAMK
jgi:hypothetical protein